MNRKSFIQLILASVAPNFFLPGAKRLWVKNIKNNQIVKIQLFVDDFVVPVPFDVKAYDRIISRLNNATENMMIWDDGQKGLTAAYE